MTVATLSGRKPLRFWGWGYADEMLSASETGLIEQMAAQLCPEGLSTVNEPGLSEFELSASRLTVPGSLQPIVSIHHYDRLIHSYGKSCADMLRWCARQRPPAPDAVAFPRSEQELADLLDWASNQNIAVIPFGGGTSVGGGGGAGGSIVPKPSTSATSASAAAVSLPVGRTAAGWHYMALFTPSLKPGTYGVSFCWHSSRGTHSHWHFLYWRRERFLLLYFNRVPLIQTGTTWHCPLCAAP